jgi:hypothetical protein
MEKRQRRQDWRLVDTTAELCLIITMTVTMTVTQLIMHKEGGLGLNGSLDGSPQIVRFLFLMNLHRRGGQRFTFCVCVCVCVCGFSVFVSVGFVCVIFRCLFLVANKRSSHWN